MTRSIRAVAVIAAIVAVGALLQRSAPAGAHVVPNQFSMEVAVGEAGVPVNSQFAAYVSIHHSGGAYAAAQWHVDYPESVVRVVNVAKDPNAPGQCAHTNDDGVRELLGCLTLDLDNLMTYSGNAWIIAFQCIADGTANINLAAGPNVASGTFVQADVGGDLPMHTHNDTVQCGAGGSPPPPPPPGGDQCTVSEVLTGDSFKCNDGKTVRLLQIDAQDLNQCGGGWAKAALQHIFLIPGRVVRLDYDADKTGPNGETMAAPIWRGNDGYDYNMSIVMVYVGLAKAAELGDGNIKYLSWAEASQTWARVAQWNMWAPGKTYTGGSD
jgi:endonuclease YncB( thermonuclease family)